MFDQNNKIERKQSVLSRTDRQKSKSKEFNSEGQVKFSWKSTFSGRLEKKLYWTNKETSFDYQEQNLRFRREIQEKQLRLRCFDVQDTFLPMIKPVRGKEERLREATISLLSEPTAWLTTCICSLIFPLHWQHE